MFNFIADLIATVDFSIATDMIGGISHHVANFAGDVSTIAGHAVDATSAAAGHAADVISEAVNANNVYESFWLKAARAARLGAEHSVVDLLRTGDRATDAQVVDLLKGINTSNLFSIRSQVLDLILPFKGDHITIFIP